MIKITGLLLGMTLSVSTFYSHWRRRVCEIYYSPWGGVKSLCVHGFSARSARMALSWGTRARWRAESPDHWKDNFIRRKVLLNESVFKANTARLQGHNVASPLSCERNRKSCILDMASSRCDSSENIVWLSWSLTLWLHQGLSCICPCKL